MIWEKRNQQQHTKKEKQLLISFRLEINLIRNRNERMTSDNR